MTVIHPHFPATQFQITARGLPNKSFSRIPASQQLDFPEPEYAEPYEAEFDPNLGCWLRVVQPEPEPIARVREPAPIPNRDGSGVFWDVVDRGTNLVMWTIEAWDFDTALVEKRRLCRLAGGTSGFCKMVRRR